MLVRAEGPFAGPLPYLSAIQCDERRPRASAPALTG
jgi:hypothetical protein